MQPAPAFWQKPHCRWLVWASFGSVWTFLLLMPFPAQAWFASGPVAHWRFPLAKTTHVLAYTLWTVLSGGLRVPPCYRWLVLFLVMAHAPASELAQRWIPNRSGTLEDVVFDHLGVALGLALSWRWWSAPVTPKE
jgi:VanZ family protein